MGLDQMDECLQNVRIVVSSLALNSSAIFFLLHLKALYLSFRLVFILNGTTFGRRMVFFLLKKDNLVLALKGLVFFQREEHEWI